METQHKDALGRPIKVGDVVVHFYVTGHAMGSHVGVVRELVFKEGEGVTKLKVAFVERAYPYYDGRWDDPERREIFKYQWGKLGSLKVTEYCVLVSLTEAELREKYGIHKS